MNTILRIEKLKKHYPIQKGIFSKKSGVVKAVDGVSIEIQRGQTVGLVGESGCGKSTIGKTLLSLQPATAGRAEFDGEVLFDIEKNYKASQQRLMAVRKKMQVIFQDPYACLDPRMSVESILTEGIRKHFHYTRTQRREIAAQLLHNCGLSEESLQKYPHQFSGGQRQRIGIARALSLQPEFIVCDEPTAALDVSIQSQILNLMLELKKEFSLSYLFISHDLQIVRHFCDEIYVMYLGRVVERAQAKSLFTHPLHPYTKALLKSMPDFESGKSKIRAAIHGEIPSPSSPPKGCLFHTRCPYIEPNCLQTQELEIAGEGHWVACHKYHTFNEVVS